MIILFLRVKRAYNHLILFEFFLLLKKLHLPQLILMELLHLHLGQTLLRHLLRVVLVIPLLKFWRVVTLIHLLLVRLLLFVHYFKLINY
jgi:hypothetical protein